MDNWGGGAVNPGIVGGGLFFLLSGSVLWRNNKGKGWRDFYKKHLIKMMIPIWVSYVLFAMVYYVKQGTLWDDSIWQVIFPMLGGNFFTVEIQKHLGFTTMNLVGEWFTSVIIILYLLYPLLRILFKSKARIATTVIIIIAFLMNFRINLLIYQNGHISLTLGLLYFWLGMLFEEHRNQISNKWISATALILAIVIWVINPNELFGIMYLPNLPIIILLYFATICIAHTSIWLRWICKYTYIMYLVHHTMMNWLIPNIGSESMGALRISLMFIVLMMLIFSVGISENMICENIIMYRESFCGKKES